MKKHNWIADMAVFAIIAVFSLLAASQSHADDVEWIGTIGSWHDPLNWDNGIPVSGDYAYIDNGGTAQISADAESYRLFAGIYNSGAVGQTGGINTVSGGLTLGGYSGASGTYNLNAGELSVGYEYIGGYQGTGNFNQSGGTNTVGYLYVKDNSSYTLSDGTLTIGDNAEIYGSFHFTDGDWALNLNGGLANFEDAVVDGAGSASFTSAANSLTIFPTGFDPAAQFGSYNALGLVHTAGSTLVISSGEGFAGHGWIGDHVQNRGNIVASGGLLNFRGGLTISDGGTLDSSNYGLKVDNGATVTIAASGGELSVGSTHIGGDGTGEFNQTGGTHTVDDYLHLGYESGSSGIYNLSAGELSVGNNECIGRYGTGIFTQTGGTNTVESNLYMGYGSGSSGTYALGGGMLSAKQEYIGFDGTGEFNQTGGIHTVGYLYVKDDSSYSLSSGTLSISDNAEVNGSFHFTDGDWSLNVNGGLANFADAVIDGAGSAFFNSAANTLTIFPTGFDPAAQFGSYNALGLVHTAGSTLVISPGESFAGRGWIGDHVQNRGNIVASSGSIEFSSGSLDFRGGLTISDGGTLDSSNYRLTVDNGATVTIAASGGELSARNEYIGDSGTGVFNQDGGTHTISWSLYIGYESGSSGTYNLSAGELFVNHEEYIGYRGTGQFNQTGGTHSVAWGDLYLGYASGSSGTYNLSAGELIILHREYIGRSGTGEFNQTGGTHTVGYHLWLGYYSDSSGTYNLGGTGELSANSEYIGYRGTGEFNQTGGTHTVSESVYIGYRYRSDSSGTYNLSAGELSVGNSEYIGYEGTAEFNQDGGTHTVSSSMNLGNESGSSGTYNLSDGVLSVGSREYIGRDGIGEFNQTGGTNTVSESLYVGYGFGSSGTYNLSAGELSVGIDEHIGYDGTGEFNQNGGTYTVSESLYVGYGFVSSGTYNLSTGELSVGIDEHIGYDGTGEFNQNGGTHTVSNYLYLGYSSGSSGTYNLSAGELSSKYEYIGGRFYGDTGTGEFNQTGGIHTVSNYLYLGYYHDTNGTYNLGGTGELSADSECIGYYGTGKFNQDGGTHTVGSSLYLGYSSGSSGTYNLDAGELSAGSSEYIGRYGTGEFNQDGGIHSVGGELLIGILSGTGTYNMSGGVLETVDLVIGNNGSFNVMDNSAVIEVGGSGSLTFEQSAKYSAVLGTVIYMKGAAFDNQSLSSANVAGLHNTVIIYEGSAPGTTFEVASFDMGPATEGFANNFALGGLSIGSEQAGYIRLVDNYVNFTPEGPQTQSEALYVKKLVLGAGSTLDLNGYHLYTLCYTDNGGEVLNGEINVIPEPSTLFLLAPALLGFAGVARKKCRSVEV